jgi:hypothetical protein
MVELWRGDAIERSWRVLGELRKLVDFVVIGGWGVYFWTRKLKSRDIDVYIDQDNFYMLQAEALKAGFPIKRNPRLKKFEALIDGVEIDIYTPFMCNLAIPCEDVFREKLVSIIEGFRVATPEALLLLKAQAAKERWHSEKGVKDRADIISLFAFTDLKFDMLEKLREKYDADNSLINIVRKILREGRAEFKLLGLSYERDGAKLRKVLEKKIKGAASSATP